MPWYQTRLTELLQISRPIIQAGMAGGITSPRLVAAVSNAGGLGSLGAGYMSPEDIRQAIREIRKQTDRPFAVNLMVPAPYETNAEQERLMKNHLKRFEEAAGASGQETTSHAAISFEEQIHVILEEKVPVACFTFGIPSPAVIQELHARHTVVIGTATSVREAVEVEKSGMDAVVAQGSEAGGHRGTFLSAEFPYVGTMALIPQVVDHVRIPVVAAGGVMDGRGVLASLALGADGVQMGSAFLPTLESSAHDKHKEAVLQSTDESTVMTTVFSGKPARAIQNEFIREMENYPHPLPPYPVQNALTKHLRQAASKKGNKDYMALWAGQAAALSRFEQVEELMQRIMTQVDQCLSQLTGEH
ncbi:nitronate monooxygenase family protein [Thermoactinomyces sp. Gus2-1]|uniref:NAD(P)H-dependent flavin oxidoreductase n=1 Tax=Thermoactinomyces sp. Gus2-1 TaxID=1535750 RepID=UPI000503EBB4|nr:nitronate monooxygenase [Thermoactinomyces sp. Gus2-1]KFZ40363.1 nitronate monooxygenase [Thermoactinomyces sp. Gus2-1]